MAKVWTNRVNRMDKDTKRKEVLRSKMVRNWNGATSQMFFSFCPFCHAYTYIQELQRCRKDHNWNGARCCNVETKIMRPMWSKCSKHSFSIHFTWNCQLKQLSNSWYGSSLWLLLGLWEPIPPSPTTNNNNIQHEDRKKCSGWKSCSFATFPNWMSFDDLRTNNGSIVIRRSVSLSQSQRSQFAASRSIYVIVIK